MKKIILFFALLLAGAANSFAQIDQQFLVAGENNSLNETEMLNGFFSYEGGNESGFYFSSIYKKKLRIYHVDKTGKQDANRNSFEVKMEGENNRYIRSIVVDNRFYILSGTCDINAGKYTVYAQLLDSKTLEDSGAPVQIGSGNIKPGLKFLSMYFVDVVLSPSGKKMFLFCSDVKSTEGGPVTEKMIVYNGLLSSEYEITYKLEAGEKEQAVTIPRVLDDSTAFIEMTNYSKIEGKKILRSRIFRHYGKKGLIKEVALDVEKVKNVGILDMHMAGENIWLTSKFFPKEWELFGDYNFPEGIINILWETEQNQITKYIQMPWKELGIVTPDEEKEISDRSSSFRVEEHVDGSFTVYTEWRIYYSYLSAKQESRTFLKCTDLYVARFSETGALLWNRSIPKKQAYRLGLYHFANSFVFVKDGADVIVFNDNAASKPKIVTITRNGKVSEEEAQNPEFAKSDIVPRLSAKINEDLFFIYTHKGINNAYRLFIYDKRK